MNQLKRIMCLILVALFVVACVGCNNSSTSSGSNPAGSTEHRPHYDDGTAEVEEVVKQDNDHVFDYKLVEWDGPEGYVIVVPAGNTEAKNSAKYLQNYYKNAFNVNLSIVTDKNTAKDKEILIGKTNREESDKNLAEADLSVAIKGTKLVFDGGHDVSVDSAVKKFARLVTETKKAATFKLTTDFVSELDKKYGEEYVGYEYVWGDEFEGEGIANSWFLLIPKMRGNDKAELSKEKNVVDVSDGRLKLRALSYFNNDREGTEYRIPCSPVTHETMNFRYGYAEIRARVPYKWGIFPSWWAQSTAGVCGYRDEHVMFEVDVFEIFNCWEKTPGIVQWYDADFNYTGKYPNCWKLTELLGANRIPAAGNAVSITYAFVGSNDKVYKWPETRTSLSYEYHTYGYEWTPTELVMYIDGEEHADFDISKPRDSYGGYGEPMLPGTNSPIYFHDPQGFIFNCHIFLDGVSLASKPVTQFPKSLPSEYFVDWIRLYQTDKYDSKVYFDDQREYLN